MRTGIQLMMMEVSVTSVLKGGAFPILGSEGGGWKDKHINFTAPEQRFTLFIICFY